jgi:Zn-dependent peptidase ImmA (M78 family)
MGANASGVAAVKSPKIWLSPQRIEQIRSIALERLRLTRYSGGSVDIERVAGQLGATVRFGPYEGELAGMLIRSGGRPVIAVNSAHHRNRQRFTIAHECGHLILHSDRDVFVDRSFSILRRDENSSKAENYMEVEANQFAAEILMPASFLKRDLVRFNIDLEDDSQIAVLAKKYSVSAQAMSYRVANLFMSSN